MRPTDKSSVLDKAKWELDQVQHTNASFHNYEKTGINPGIKDISPTRLADIDADTIEGLGCTAKYFYLDDDRKNCPFEMSESTGGPGDCFKDVSTYCPDNLEGTEDNETISYRSRVWET